MALEFIIPTGVSWPLEESKTKNYTLFWFVTYKGIRYRDFLSWKPLTFSMMFQYPTSGDKKKEERKKRRHVIAFLAKKWFCLLPNIGEGNSPKGVFGNFDSKVQFLFRSKIILWGFRMFFDYFRNLFCNHL